MEETMQIFAATGDVSLALGLKQTLKLVMPVKNEFHSCGNAEDSVRLASYYGPSVVFVDERISNYCQVVAEIRAESPGAVVILVTATAGIRALAKALACGARDYLARDCIDVESIDRCVWGAVAAWSERAPVPTNIWSARQHPARIWN